ncbi:MAG TPA: hypothetical protein VNA20_17590 [Frankiaceae bacterium]|nr:hypothetical protein [Frankiaceae bacterium]
MDVRRFTRADVPFAASLLAARGNAHPLVAPFDAAVEITELLDAGHEGWVCDTGYVIGRVDADAAWSLYPGHAARDVAAYRHLYAAMSRDWVGAGQRRHAVLVPEGDAVAGEAFANLAFGREHVLALASLADQPSGAGGAGARSGSRADAGRAGGGAGTRGDGDVDRLAADEPHRRAVLADVRLGAVRGADDPARRAGPGACAWFGPLPDSRRRTGPR